MAQIIRLSPFDLIAPHDFSRQLLFFSFSDQYRDNARASFKIAFTNLIRRFPFLAGKVIPYPRDGPGHRALQINPDLPRAWDPEEEGILRYTYSENPYEKLRQNAFAAEEDEWARFHWLPVLADATAKKKGTPVLAAQVNFLRGGLLLAMSFDHGCMDGRGYCWVYRRLAEELRIAHIATQDDREMMPEFSCVGLQPFHTIRYGSGHVDRPRELKVRPHSAVGCATGSTSSATATFKFRVAGLQRILRSNGAPTSPFRCISALLFIAITRARLISKTCSRNRDPRCVLITNMRESLGAPPNAVGNAVLYGYFDAKPDEVLEDGDLAGLPPILTRTVDAVCSFINETREPGYAQQRLGYLNRQIYDLGVDPSRVGVDVDSKDNDVIFNTWEEFPTGRDEFPILGALDCVRKPLTFIDGYVLVAPRSKDSEFVGVSVGLKEPAMTGLMRELAGWKAKGWLVNVEQ